MRIWGWRAPKRRVEWLAVAVMAGGCMLWAQPAHAYIDAGTGGLLVQMLLAGIAGAAVIIRMYWQKITGIFGRREK